MKFGKTLKRDYKQLLFVCAAFSAMAFSSYWFVSLAMKRQMDLHGRSEMRAYQTAMRSLVLAHEDALQHAALSISEALRTGAGPDELLEILKSWTNFFRGQKDIKDVFVSVYGYLDGNYLDGSSWIPGKFFYPKTAPWMTGALIQDGIFHSRPYVDPRTGNAVSAVSMVVFDKTGDSRGVLALDYLLNPVLEQVKAYRVGDAGQGMLLDDSFNVLTHRDGRNIGRPLGELAEYSAVYEKLKRVNDDVLVENVHDGEVENVGFFTRLENGWYLGIMAPIRYYYGEVYGMASIIAALAFSLAATLCVILVRLSEARVRSDLENRAKSSFLARMSHEIRTPMNAIIGMGDLAYRDYGTPQAREYIAEIRHSGRYLLSIINDLLDFSKIESGNFRINSSPYHVSSLLNDVLTIIGVRAGEKSLRLQIEIAPDIPRRLIGDEVRIRQIMLNLLSNALKYTHKGGLTFSAKSAPRDPGVELTFSVEDTGIGIRPEDMENLFKDFVRLDRTSEDAVEGTGLGLSISRSLCRAMDGDITAASVHGKGSIFTAAIMQNVADWTPLGPFDRIGGGKADLQRQDAIFYAPGFRILIVDDVSTNLIIARGLLSPFGFEITTCLGGREALEAVKKSPFDLILLDHMMPEPDGIETLRMLRALGKPGSAPVVALTANAMTGMREMFLSHGFDDYLSKPIEDGKLLELLEKWVPPAARQEKAPGAGGSDPAGPTGFAINGIDVELGLRRMRGSRRDYLRLLAAFRRDAASCLPFLDDVPEAGIDAFVMQVHALKGASANIGAVALAEESRRLEEAGKMRDFRTIRDALEGYRRQVAGLIDDIRNVLESEAASEREEGNLPGGGMPEAGELVRLKEAIRSRNIQAIDRNLDQLLDRRYPGKTGTALSLAADYLLASDFREAESVVDELLKEAGA
ncbi:MAG: response regulator [Planctomycetota bacterium]|jgi:signal transduction histidine kinase/HPt (histidine-containing phosphotransfer) domain-containing protein/ActR/RegA family two-component response regulator|nr:response regulator [Planctomycetota bacterium]